MERKVGFEHTLTKQMSLVKYLTEAYPKEYTIVDSKYILPNKVEITYSNIVPVIVGINPNNFGIPETRKTIKKAIKSKKIDENTIWKNQQKNI